jgi:RNA polymerase subunit RPABC4/transcription elongation factor Spt4
MHSYFARHEVDKKGKDWDNQSSPSAGRIAWLGWGGDAGRSWVNGIMKKLNANESQETIENMASTRAAVVRGIFIRPGMSRNRRLYTRENIGKAVERMQTQLSSGEGLPITMATSHGAAFTDDALSTVGRLVSVKQLPDGSAMFEAEIANTTQGRDIAALAVGKFIKGVSIRGEWLGNLETVVGSDGKEATTAGDLKIIGVDFTHSPGVEGAEIQYAALAESFTSSPYNIVESIEQVEVIDRELSVVADEAESIIRAAVEDAVSSIMEKTSSKPYGDVSYADPGYQSDKKKRYPIDTAKHVRAAWSYINQADNAKAYSPAQIRRIKSKIKAAAKKFNIEIQEEYNNLISDLRDAIETQGVVNPSESQAIASQLAHIAMTTADEASLNARGEDLKTILRHDAGHDDWHAKHGDPPCKSPEDCARMAASYEEDTDEMDDNNMECEHCGAPGCPKDSNYCPMCGENISSFDNIKSSNECESCGTECHEDAIHCHMCGTPLPSSMTNNALGCGNCGESTPEDAMYCPTCGDPVPQAEANKADYATIIPNRKGEPADKALYAKVIAAAKAKFDVYPSAVANAWASQEYKRRGGKYTTQSAESQDEALTHTKENVNVDQNTTAAETSAEESGHMPVARTLNDADLKAIAAMVIAGLKPTENASEEEEVEVVADDAETEVETPEVEAEVEVEVADDEAPAAEEATIPQENIVENLFTAEQVAVMIAEAASKAATEAVAAATKQAVESYRSGGAARKGLSGTSNGNDASELVNGEITSEMLSEMNSSDFRKVQSEVWANTAFFNAKFAQADRGF